MHGFVHLCSCSPMAKWIYRRAENPACELAKNYIEHSTRLVKAFCDWWAVTRSDMLLGEDLLDLVFNCVCKKVICIQFEMVSSRPAMSTLRL